MWTISELKTKAKVAFKANYWVSVVAGLIITFFAYGAASSSGRGSDSEDSSTIIEALKQIDPTILIASISAILGMAVIFAIIKALIGNPLVVGSKKVFVLNESAEKPGFETIISIFKSGKFVNVAIVMFLKDLIVGLLSLLCLIPGIYFGYKYRMVSYLLAEDPSLSFSEATQKSSEMMNGHKMKTFLLDLSFIGWAILSGLTCGILAIFYVSPYMEQTTAELYLTLKNN